MSRRRWTQSELDIVRREYPDTLTADLAKRIDRSERAVYMVANSLGLKKTSAYMVARRAESGRFIAKAGARHRFQKGMKPWNKGKRHNPPGSEAGRFRLGNRPQTWLPVGAERVTKDGIRERKVADTRDKKADWRPVHVLIWEKHYGPVPDGHFVVFKNRDQPDIRIDNLLLVDRAENMRRNTVHRYPKPLARAILMRGALNRQIRKRRENHG